MPCWIQIEIYQEEFESLPSMKDACKQLGLKVEERGGEIWIGGSIKAKRVGKKYIISSQNGTLIRSVMDEYAAAKISREASRRNMTVKREKASNGQITLKVIQN